jgi:hypothetical protein
MKYPKTPELIGEVEEIDKDGNSNPKGDKILGICVRQDKSRRDGEVNIDVRGLGKNANLVIRVDLPELMTALHYAILNADRDIE